MSYKFGLGKNKIQQKCLNKTRGCMHVFDGVIYMKKQGKC